MWQVEFLFSPWGLNAVKNTIKFLVFLSYTFFDAFCRDVLPTLLKHFFTKFNSCPLFTKYLVFSLDLAV